MHLIRFNCSKFHSEFFEILDNYCNSRYFHIIDSVLSPMHMHKLEGGSDDMHRKESQFTNTQQDQASSFNCSRELIFLQQFMQSIALL
jgi:hypothetical protein